MKIIKRNKKYLWVECDCCGSILEPSSKDIEKHILTAKFPNDNPITVNGVMYVRTRRDIVAWTICPVCLHRIEVRDTKKESYEPY